MNQGRLLQLWLRLREWLLSPVIRAEDRVHAIEERVVVLEKQALQQARERLQVLLTQLALVAATGILALIGGVYCLIGLWLAAGRWVGATAASIILGALFVLAALVPWVALRRMRRAAANCRTVG